MLGSGLAVADDERAHVRIAVARYCPRLVAEVVLRAVVGVESRTSEEGVVAAGCPVSSAATSPQTATAGEPVRRAVRAGCPTDAAVVVAVHGVIRIRAVVHLAVARTGGRVLAAVAHTVAADRAARTVLRTVRGVLAVGGCAIAVAAFVFRRTVERAVELVLAVGKLADAVAADVVLLVVSAGTSGQRHETEEQNTDREQNLETHWPSLGC